MAGRYTLDPECSSFQSLLHAAKVLDLSTPNTKVILRHQTALTADVTRHQPSLRTLPRFLTNLWTMLNEKGITCINWSGTNSFVISSRKELTRSVLPKFFKHNRLSSFTRQLHMYQFMKVKDKGSLDWTHVFLNRENYHSLFKIRRKHTNHDSKLQNIADGLFKTVEEQDKKIVQLESRMVVLENELKRAEDMRVFMENQIAALREVLRPMCCPTPSLDSFLNTFAMNKT